MISNKAKVKSPQGNICLKKCVVVSVYRTSWARKPRIGLQLPENVGRTYNRGMFPKILLGVSKSKIWELTPIHNEVKYSYYSIDSSILQKETFLPI